MKYTFQALKNDHIYFEQLLDQLDKMVISLLPEKEPNWSSIAHLINTLCHYPEFNHHPMEDNILEQLKTQHWISDLVIESMRRDHERLHALGTMAQAQLSSTILSTNLKQIEHALYAISMFTTAYRSHIRIEEELVFPMVAKLMNKRISELTVCYVDYRDRTLERVH